MFVAGDFPFDPQRRFRLRSIDVAHLYDPAYLAPGTVSVPFELTFFGWVGSFSSGFGIAQTFRVPAPPAVPGAGQAPVLVTLAFDERWSGLGNVWWYQSDFVNTLHQFTNVHATVIPEPGTYLLTATGLAALALVHRRRRRS